MTDIMFVVEIILDWLKDAAKAQLYLTLEE